MLQRPAVGLLLPGDHPEQRRLAGAVGTDDADDAAARQREVEAVDQQVVAVALPETARLDDDVAEPRPGRDVDLGRLDLLGGVLAQQVLVGVEARLALGLARARRHPDPFELALERALALALRLLFERQPLLLLLEPRRVVAFPGNAAAAVELENPAGDVVEEIAIVRDGDDGAGVVLEEALEPGDRFGVEMVGRLVEQQQVGRLQQQAAQRDAAALAARQRRDVGIGGRQPQRVHRQLEPRVEIPGVGRVDLVLNSRLLVEDLVHLVGRQVLAELRVHLVVARQQRLDGGDALFDVAEDVLLPDRAAAPAGRNPTEMPSAGNASPRKLRVLAGHDAQQRALAGAVHAEHADLRAEIEREPDVFEHPGVGRMHLPEALHGVDELRHGGNSTIDRLAIWPVMDCRFDVLVNLTVQCRCPIRRIIHVDMDAFYASVEQRDDPALRGQPLAVGGQPDRRGVVAAASYEARAFGVRSAMSMAKAVRLCPSLVIVPPDFQRYKAASHAVFCDFPRSHAAGRAAVARRGVPRRHRERVGRAARDARRAAAEGAHPRRHRPHRVGRRRAEQVSGEDRVGLEEAGRPDGHQPRARRAVPATAAGRRAVGRRTGDGPQAAKSRHRAAGGRPRPSIRSCCARRSAAWPTGCGSSPTASTIGRSCRTGRPSRRAAKTPIQRTSPTSTIIRREVAEMADHAAGWLARKQLLARTVTIKVRYSDFTTVTRSHTAAPTRETPTSSPGRCTC